MEGRGREGRGGGCKVKKMGCLQKRMPICEAVKIVMGNENQIGREVRANYEKIINFFLSTSN
jgi:hypothetical protein